MQGILQESDEQLERVAPATLIQAAAGLEPADRALLNLWMASGLPDRELAAMAGVRPETITSRKLDLVELLSVRLAVPPYAIVAALAVARALGPARRRPAAARRRAQPRSQPRPEPERRPWTQPERAWQPPTGRPPQPARELLRPRPDLVRAPLPPVPIVRLRSGLRPLPPVTARRSSARGGHAARRDRHAPVWLAPLPEPAPGPRRVY